MKIEFLKDHFNYKAGSQIDNHPNESYLIVLGVAKEVKKAKKKDKKEK